ncbi:MAG: hypothetical protein DRJ45_08265, partial [Thermoprotei archaeon]
MSLEPFRFDDIIKWGINSTEAYNEAKRHGVRYIVVDRRWMLRNSPDAYDKFSDKRLFRAVESINGKLSCAEVYEVINATSIKNIEVIYTYWSFWRIFGLALSIIFTSIFIRSVIQSDKVFVREKKRKIVEEHMVELRILKPGIIKSWGKLLDLLMYIFTTGLIFLILIQTKAPIGFPKGTDAYAHLYRIKYIVKFFPNFFWNYQWDMGTPIFGGSYPPLSYYLGALIVYIAKLPYEMALNILSTTSVIINILFLLAFLKAITNSRIISLISISLLIFTPSYWEYWVEGGNYGRVISMMFIGPSLYLTWKIYQGKSRRRILLFALPVILAAGICTHLLGGLIAFFLVSTYILFRSNLIDGFIDALKLMIIVASLIAFYITQCLFSNPTAMSIGPGGITYNPANIQNLFIPSSILTLNSMAIPILIASLLIYISLRNKGLYGSENVRGWFVASFLLSMIFLIYSYVGYIPGYPKDLYINGFPPEYALGVLPIGLIIFTALLLHEINLRVNVNHFRIIALFILISSIAFGITVELPVIKAYTYNSKTMVMNFIMVDKNNLQQRLGSDTIYVTLWFSYIYDTPQTGGYYSLGVPYLDWCSWRNNAIWKFKNNDNETQFLLDWYAIRWIVLINRDPYKFLHRPDIYRLLTHIEYKFYGSCYEFEYLNASKILTATDATPILFIGSDLYYDTFLRALSLTGLRSNLCIPV